MQFLQARLSLMPINKAKEFATCHIFLGNFKKSKKLDTEI